MARGPKLVAGPGGAALGLMGGAAGPGEAAELAVPARGTGVGSELMTLECGLTGVQAPSNYFAGQCRLTVGADEVVVGGIPDGEARLLSVVLNGELTVRGIATQGTGRFQEVVGSGLKGFPVHLRIDPLGQVWGLRGEGPGSAESVSTGRLLDGAVKLTL